MMKAYAKNRKSARPRNSPRTGAAYNGPVTRSVELQPRLTACPVRGQGRGQKRRGARITCRFRQTALTGPFNGIGMVSQNPLSVWYAVMRLRMTTEGLLGWGQCQASTICPNLGH